GANAVYGSASGGFSEEDVLVLRAAATAAALLRHDQQSARLEGVKANFMRLASHELRSPLSVVRGYVSMMEDGTLGELNDQVAEVLPVLRTKLAEMDRLVGEMLLTARLEDGANRVRRDRLDLRQVV